jgi:hypothetical protein
MREEEVVADFKANFWLLPGGIVENNQYRISGC